MSKYKFDARLWASVQRPAQQPVKAASDNSDIHSQVCDVIRQCREGGIDITDGYDNWLHVGMALASEFGEGGRNYFHEVSQHNGGYNLAECDDKYTNILRTGRGEVTIATFFRIARDHGIEPSRTHTSNKKVGERSGDGRDDGNDTSALENFLRSKGDWRHNVISECIEFKPIGKEKWDRVEDYLVNSLWRQAKNSGLKYSVMTIWNIINSDFSPHFNAVEDYLGSLDKWTPEQPDYIAAFAAMVHTDGSDDILVQYFRKWFVAMVANWLDRGINQQVFVLIGPQGIYKTSWLNSIIPPELKEYCFTKMDCSRMTKDDRLKVSRHLLINLEELDVQAPSEMNQTKSLVTAEATNERAAYGHTEVHRKRRASFVGSGNNEAFLTDRTGSRRWLTFKTIGIDSPFNNIIPYEGMYSQALYLLDNGFDFYFGKEDIAVINERNKQFEAPDVIAEVIHSFFRRPEEGEQARSMSAGEIYTEINVYTRLNVQKSEIGLALTSCGFESKYIRGTKKYKVVFIDHDRRKQNQRMESASEFASVTAETSSTEEDVAEGNDTELPF